MVQIDETQLRERMESHLINYNALSLDNFDICFIDRTKIIGCLGNNKGRRINYLEVRKSGEKS